MRKGRRKVVIDTNVPIVANRRDGGSYLCASACAQELMRLRSNGTLVVDAQGLILAEYRSYLNYKGQPGAGDAFIRWFFNNRGKADLCTAVHIRYIDHEWRQFAEFPDDEALANFDKADQKFVATAIAAAPENVVILQAADHKWLQWSESLESYQVKVQFLCQAELERTKEGKKRN